MSEPLRMDPAAWQAGYAAGLVDAKACPYPRLSDLAWAWSSGWIEGEAARLKRPTLRKIESDK